MRKSGQMERLSKKLFFVSLFFALGLVFLVAASFLIEPEVVEIMPPPQTATSAEKEEITIILAGDIMLNRGVEDMIDKQGAGDFKFPFLEIVDYLNEADIVFGNLESVISDRGSKVGSTYSFRADPKAVEGLTFAGFDVVSVANNHIFDYGRAAMEDSFLRLKEAGIAYVGGGFNEGQAYAPVVKEIENTKIAFLAYTNLGSPSWAAKEEDSGVAWLEKDRMESDIKTAKNQADLVIVSFHYGDEYEPTANSFQVAISRAAIDAGADLVVGHHPHVAQSVEEYGEGYIVYSLGNFIFDQDFSKETMKGFILKVIVEDNQIEGVVPVNIKINNFFQPEIESPVF